MRRGRWHCLGILLVAAAGPATAHHSRAAFDLEALIEVEGTVTEVAWTNPHFYLGLEDHAGTAWTFEGHSVPGLVRNGWRKDTLTVGAPVQVVANPNQNENTAFALLSSVTRADGKTFYSFKPTDEVASRARAPMTPSTGLYRHVGAHPLAEGQPGGKLRRKQNVASDRSRTHPGRKLCGKRRPFPCAASRAACRACSNGPTRCSGRTTAAISSSRWNTQRISAALPPSHLVQSRLIQSLLIQRTCGREIHSAAHGSSNAPRPSWSCAPTGLRPPPGDWAEASTPARTKCCSNVTPWTTTATG